MTSDDEETFFREAEQRMYPKVRGAAFTMSLIENEEPSAQFCMELGAAIMFEKPIVVMALKGMTVPEPLRALAYAVIEADPTTDEGRARGQVAMGDVLARLMADGYIPVQPTVHTIHPDGSEHDEVLRTKSGKIVTEDDIDLWAAEAEEGYVVDHPFQPILAGETRKPNDEPKCQECGKRKGLHKTLKPRSKG